MKKIILTAKHGRPSTKLAWSFLNTNNSNPITLVQRRQFTKKNGKFITYYRAFGDTEQYDESQLYQLKFKNFNFDNSVIIRWGTRENINASNSIIYNTAKAIANATDKLVSRQLFAEKGVATIAAGGCRASPTNRDRRGETVRASRDRARQRPPASAPP
jgi:chitinase